MPSTDERQTLHLYSSDTSREVNLVWSGVKVHMLVSSSSQQPLVKFDTH